MNIDYEITSEEVADLRKIKLDLSYFFKISPSIVRKYKLVPISGDKESINMAVVKLPSYDAGLAQASRVLKLHFRVTFVTEESFEEVCHEYYRKINPTMQKKLQIGLSPNQDPIDFCNVLLALAYLKGASDIHIDPEGGHFSIGFRIDGTLYEEQRLASKFYNSIISRLKVLSNMKIAEKREPQDGYIKYEFQGLNHFIEIRTATLPTKFGERMAMRIVDASTSFVNVKDLQFSEYNRNAFEKAITYSYGFILVTGPTGSGKSTTLYSAMNQLCGNADLKIITFEDPIERDLEGVTQVQIEGKVGFARCLKSVLRHDPDIIMIGEIRDQETADIGVRAAITGHLVLSTLHTNSVTATIFRLLDLGVESFVLSSILRLVTAQRLVRRLCKYCAIKREITQEEIGLINRPQHKGKMIHEKNPEGCQFCAKKGYSGRISILEVLENKLDIAQLIAEGVEERILRKKMTEVGMLPILDDGLEKVFDGFCSLHDVVKVSLSA